MHNLDIYRLSLLLVSVSLFLTGCEQNLDLDKYRNPEIEKMLVVNSILSPEDTMGVSVTHPYFFSDPHTSFHTAENVDVKIKEGGGKWETLNFDDRSKLYKSNRKPMAGERVEIMIEYDLKKVTSFDTVPEKVVIDSVTATGEGPMHIYGDKDFRFTYKITFTDPEGEENYYFLSIEDDALPYEMSQMGQVDYTVDYVFQVIANMINQKVSGWQPDGVLGYPFCDKGIDGQKYTITVSEVLQNPWISRIEKLPRRINLYSVSRAYFEYMMSILSMDYDQSAFTGNLLSLGLIEPTKIFSNITGGTGLMGSYNLHTVKVDLLKLAGGWPRK